MATAAFTAFSHPPSSSTVAASVLDSAPRALPALLSQLLPWWHETSVRLQAARQAGFAACATIWPLDIAVRNGACTNEEGGSGAAVVSADAADAANIADDGARVEVDTGGVVQGGACTDGASATDYTSGGLSTLLSILALTSSLVLSLVSTATAAVWASRIEARRGEATAHSAWVDVADQMHCGQEVGGCLESIIFATPHSGMPQSGGGLCAFGCDRWRTELEGAVATMRQTRATSILTSLTARICHAVGLVKSDLLTTTRRSSTGGVGQGHDLPPPPPQLLMSECDAWARRSSLWKRSPTMVNGQRIYVLSQRALGGASNKKSAGAVSAVDAAEGSVGLHLPVCRVQRVLQAPAETVTKILTEQQQQQKKGATGKGTFGLELVRCVSSTQDIVQIELDAAVTALSEAKASLKVVPASDFNGSTADARGPQLVAGFPTSVLGVLGSTAAAVARVLVAVVVAGVVVVVMESVGRKSGAALKAASVEPNRLRSFESLVDTWGGFTMLQGEVVLLMATLVAVGLAGLTTAIVLRIGACSQRTGKSRKGYSSGRGGVRGGRGRGGGRRSKKGVGNGSYVKMLRQWRRDRDGVHVVTLDSFDKRGAVGNTATSTAASAASTVASSEGVASSWNSVAPSNSPVSGLGGGPCVPSAVHLVVLVVPVPANQASHDTHEIHGSVAATPDPDLNPTSGHSRGWRSRSRSRSRSRTRSASETPPKARATSPPPPSTTATPSSREVEAEADADGVRGGRGGGGAAHATDAGAEVNAAASAQPERCMIVVCATGHLSPPAGLGNRRSDASRAKGQKGLATDAAAAARDGAAHVDANGVDWFSSWLAVELVESVESVVNSAIDAAAESRKFSLDGGGSGGSGGGDSGGHGGGDAGTIADTPPPNLPAAHWGEADCSPFVVRGPTYPRDKVKVAAGEALFKIVATDIWSVDDFLPHIASQPGNRVQMVSLRRVNAACTTFHHHLPAVSHSP